jgi:hypothetical protein
MQPLNIFRSVVAIAGAVFLFSCGGTPEKTAPDTIPYYDFKGFIEGEIKALPASGYSVHKYLVWDGKKEEIVQPAAAINWEKELAWFEELDLRKPANAGLYTADTLEDEKQRLAVSYNLDYSKTRHRPALLGAHYFIREDSTVMLGGIIYRDDLFSTEEINLRYDQGKYYEIIGYQKIKRTGIEHRFSITGRFDSSHF